MAGKEESLKSVNSVDRPQDEDVSERCCGVVKSCPGKGEIAIRILGLIALGFMAICGFAGSAGYGRLRPEDNNAIVTTLKNNASAAFIWLLVAGITAIGLETLILFGRFCCSITKCNVGMLVTDIVIGLVIAVAIICGIAPLAVYMPTALNLVIVEGDTTVKTQITAAMGATVGFGIVAVALYLMLAVYMIMCLCLKCKNTSRRRYSILSESGESTTGAV